MSLFILAGEEIRPPHVLPAKKKKEKKDNGHGFIRVIEVWCGVCSRNEILDSLPINFIVPRKFAGVNDNGVAFKDDQSYYVAILHPLFQGEFVLSVIVEG